MEQVLDRVRRQQPIHVYRAEPGEAGVQQHQLHAQPQRHQVLPQPVHLLRGQAEVLQGYLLGRRRRDVQDNQG